MQIIYFILFLLIQWKCDSIHIFQQLKKIKKHSFFDVKLKVSSEFTSFGLLNVTFIVYVNGITTPNRA